MENVTIDQFALDFAYNQCDRRHTRLRAHTCVKCQHLFHGVRRLATKWELELAKSVLRSYTEPITTLQMFCEAEQARCEAVILASGGDRKLHQPTVDLHRGALMMLQKTMAMLDNSENMPDCVKMAREITAFPGETITITILPGWIYRKLKPVAIFLMLTVFGTIIAMGLS
jgi:hypothetical protein